MSRSFAAAAAAATLLSGGLTAAAVGLTASPAYAVPQCSPSNANVPPCMPPEGLPACNADGDCGQLWCPGSGMNAIPGWDMNVCHTFHFDPAAPLTKPVMLNGNPPGPPPPPPPPCILFINCLPGLTHP
ncbi:hypothetical protein SBI67_12860 [Mycolicibacterium sp. 120266]|uniref:hypothetical protein n=1 Tax=Mycolicibacterium sp. 120266 TaxID=3090601 RepID=UPI00299DA577|nr:hypothetical protein [Mycolicibacterium sp. 120266]MDX1873016.1 hypothetical protein [Mycolicibacterium sp. 120266]